MKIVCISDTHLRTKRLDLPDADVLIHSGDHSNDGKLTQLELSAEFLGQYKNQFGKIFAIAGNHDFFAQEHPQLTEETFKKHGVTYLQDCGTWYEGVYFYGSPWQPWFYDWAFNFPPDNVYGMVKAKRIWSFIPDFTNVLITHGPPAGILDKTNPEDARVGCPYLYDRLEDLKDLKLHAFGHIHEANGKVTKYLGVEGRPTTFVNAAICDLQRYNPVQPYHLVEI